MAVKSSPRGKRSKPHCLEVELVKTACGAAAGVVEVERRAAAVHGGAADTPEEAAGCTARRNKGQGRLQRSGARHEGDNKGSNGGRAGSSRQKLENAEKAGRKTGRSSRHAGWERSVENTRSSPESKRAGMSDNSKVSCLCRELGGLG